MSLLAQQLNKLKQNNVLSIAPGAPRPSFILDKQTANHTTVDVLYTMAVMGYSQIRKSIFQSCRSLVEQLLSEQYRQINRNKLTKQQNKALSVKLTRLLLVISPVFLNKGCQAIIQYLIRNFNIHVFESEQIMIIYLQYWHQQAYSKLISNIQIKSPHLQFLAKLQQKQKQKKKEEVNFSYIIKSVGYSRSLVQSLILFAKKYIKQQKTESEQMQIELVSRVTLSKMENQQQNIVMNSFKQFVLQVLIALLQRNISDFNKQMCQFCLFLSKDQCEQNYSMCMILSISILSRQESSSQWINKVIKNFLSKSVQLNQSVFNFVIIVWQRWPILITNQILSTLLQKQHFVLRLTQFKHNLYMPFYRLVEYIFISDEEQSKNINHKATVLQILRTITLKVKSQQFVNIHQSYYFSKVFKLMHENYNSVQKKILSSFKKYINEYLCYQYAVFISQHSQKIQPLDGIFVKEQFTKNDKFNWSNIHRRQMQPRIQEEEQKQLKQVQSQLQSQPETQRKQHNTILNILNKMRKFKNGPLTKIDLTHPQTKSAVVNLILQYYNINYQGKQQNEQSMMLTPEQKNKLFEQNQLFNELYDCQKFYNDIDRRDYNTAIKFMMKEGNVQMCYNVLQKLAGDIEAAGDLLYRQLCRQAVQKLGFLAKNHYKGVINTLGKLYHLYCKNTQNQLIKPINQMMLKLSKCVLSASGLNKGKFYKLIACHAKYLAILTMSQVYAGKYAFQTYQKLIQIFGIQNSYCFIIGASQLLATKMKNKKHFGNFIDRILVPSLRLNYQNQGQVQSQKMQYLNILYLLKTVNKCVTFCIHVLQQQSRNGQQQPEQKDDQNNQNQNVTSKLTKNNRNIRLDSGVAKKMIINFFGLTTTKGKRSVVRKVFMFLSSLLKSQTISAMFKESLSNIQRKKQLKLCYMASKIYSLLINVERLSKGPLQQTSAVIKSNILKLFPLQLRIDVLGPLLPLNQVYLLLSTDLSENDRKKFNSLTFFINIKPNEASDQWCKFAIQCLKRGYIPNQQVCASILDLYQQGIPELNTNIVKFICSMTQFAKEQCLVLLPKMMQIIFKQSKQPNSYTLAMFYTLIKNLKQYIDPYLSQIFRIGIQVNDEHTKKFINGLVQSFMAPVLITLTKTHAKTVQNAFNFSYFLNKLSDKVSFQSIWKTSQNFFGRSLASLVQNEQNFTDLHGQQSQIFVNQVMKMNDNQLRKIIIDYVRWSSEKTSSDVGAGLIFNSRKNLLVLTFNKLSNKIGELFNQYYGFIFEDIVNDLKGFKVLQQSKISSIVAEKTGKRDRQMSQFSLSCCAQYIKNILGSLKSLFEHDTANEFMDSIKFDTLTPQIANVFNLTKLDQHYKPVMSEGLKPCLTSLFKNTVDDYKLKSVSTQILRMLRTKDQRIVQSIYSFYDEIVEHIDYRFLLFTDQMIPLLIEASSSRNAAVKKSVQSIIYKIQNLSGQKIDSIKLDR